MLITDSTIELATSGDLDGLKEEVRRIDTNLHWKSISYFAAANGHLPIVRWLYDIGHGHWDICALEDAAYDGHLDVVRFLHETYGLPCVNIEMSEVVDGGHLDVIRYLHDVCGVPFTVVNLTEPNGIAVLRYILESACDEASNVQ